MMNRITGRTPPPPEYAVTQDDIDEQAEREQESDSIANDSDEQIDQDEAMQEVPETQVPEPEQSAEPVVESKRVEAQREDKRRKPPRDSNRDRKPDSRSHKPQSRDRNDNGSESLDSGFDAPPISSGVMRMDIPAKPRLARPPRSPRKPLDPVEAADIMRGLSADVTAVKGVGRSMAQALSNLSIATINDLLFLLPRRYDDYTQLGYISRLLPEITTTVIGSVSYTEVRVGSGGRKDFYMEVDDGTGVLAVLFFGQHWLIRTIRRGQQVVLSGKTSIFRNRIQMVNPEWEELDAENLHTTGIVPIYPLTEKLSAKRMRRLMKDTVEYWAEQLPDYIPEATLDRAELADLGWAIKNLHFPEGQDHLRHARNRYVFDQLILLQLAILANRRDWQAVPGHALTITDDFVESFVNTVFPYPLTSAQLRAIADIRRDISSEVPMNRLLQGDVGSGKTAVAVTALAMAFSNNKQSALMAPTSILAEQHYRGLSELFEKIPGERKPVIALLTSALTNTERESVYRGLADGSIDIVIGTHAIIQSGVEFNDLAVAVIDEQHRFGVGQRGALRGKGTNPHLLVMTATPIPRTLALTLYADLDLSVMDEMPPGRIPVDTRIVHEVERERIYSFVDAEINKGRQAFIVYPLVEDSEKIEAKSATEAYKRLNQVFFRHKVGLLHGRMKPAEKDDIMAAFAAHEFDIIVTTSVAEVGVDIPNASVIIIEGANRFGLAQLHQFRGRVGRGQFASYCLLIPDNNTPEAEERLKAMESTNDGFKLAEIDWKLRGAGDLVGTRQSGRNTLQIMEAMTPQLVELAQREARTIYEEDPYLDQEQHRLLSQRVDMLYNEDSDVS
jgi:ATP-dependent DNA helicase RecG